MGFFHVVVWYRHPSPVETYNDARIGLTVIFPFRNKRFPSEFLAALWTASRATWAVYAVIWLTARYSPAIVNSE